MSSKPNPKTFMYLALGTVVIGGALCFFQFSKLGDIRVRVAKLQTEVSNPQAVQVRLDESNLKLASARQSLTHLEANVSSASYVPSLLHDLDEFGKQNGIAVTGVRPATKKPGDDEAKAKNKKPYDELIITVTGTGDYKSIENFVTNLPTFPKIVAARMVSIEPVKSAGAATQAGELNVTVELKAYVFKADASTAADAAANPAGTTAPPAGTATAPGKTPATPPVAKVPVSTGKTASNAARKVRVEG